MTDPANANRRWEGQVGDFQQTDSERELYGIDGEPIAFEWHIFPGLRSLKIFRKSRKTCKNKTLNLKNLKIEPFSCRCSMILIGRDEEIQTEGECQDTANTMVKQFEESGHPVFKGVAPRARGILRKKNIKGDHTHQCGFFEHRIYVSNSSLCKSAQYLRRSVTLVGVKILGVTSDEKPPKTINDDILKEVQPKEVTSLVKVPRNAQFAAGNSLKFNRTSKHWEQKSNLQVFVKKRHSFMKLLSEVSTEQPQMWMMISEIELLYAESFHVLVQTLIPESLLRLHKEQLLDQSSASSSHYKVSWHIWN